MESLIENIEKNNQFSEQELGQLTNWLYGSVALSSKDNVNQYKKKAQTLDFLIAFLKECMADCMSLIFISPFAICKISFCK